MIRRAMLAGAALLALGGCDYLNPGRGDNSADGNVAIAVEENGADTAASANTAEAGAGNQTSSAGAPTLSRDYIVGRWTDTGDCADAITFQADGTLLGPGGGGEPKHWELNGDQLAMVGNPQTLTIAPVDRNTMDTTNGAGRTRRVTRC